MKLLLMMLVFSGWNTAVFSQGMVIKQGHRGCRGLMPENTIAAMKKAIEIGVDVLELDVVISKDKQVVVSHDPYMASTFCLKPSGDTISASEEKDHVLYNMPYNEIKKYDAGSKKHRHFAGQQNFKAHKPLLSELIDSADDYARALGKSLPSYNIEIKSEASTDNIHQPGPTEFVALVMAVCRQKNIIKRMNIQSFDTRPLQILHKNYPEVELAYLTENVNSIRKNIVELGFTPKFYSPYYKTVTKEAIEYCHSHGMKIIPWTVNNREEINALIELGVDGIITDYPNYFY